MLACILVHRSSSQRKEAPTRHCTVIACAEIMTSHHVGKGGGGAPVLRGATIAKKSEPWLSSMKRSLGRKPKCQCKHHQQKLQQKQQEQRQKLREQIGGHQNEDLYLSHDQHIYTEAKSTHHQSVPRGGVKKHNHGPLRHIYGMAILIRRITLSVTFC